MQSGLTPIALRISANGTTTPTPAGRDALLTSLLICVSGAGTAWTITVQDKAGTPRIIVSSGTVTANQQISLPPCQEGYLMAGGIDIVAAGTTAGVANVFLTYTV